jgi:Ca-activated chloride channel homolog
VTSDRPELLLIGLVAIPVLLILWRRYVTGRRDLRVLGGNWLKVDVANVFVVKWFFSSLFFLLFVLSTCAALAGFRWGSTPVADERSGQEIVFVFDLSNSMRADDIAPSRLRRAAILAKEISQSAVGSKFGVVGFKGHASLLVPMTEDLTALQNLLDVLSPELITSPGTDIESGIDRGIDSFTGIFDTHRVMFLFTDGEALSGDPTSAAERAVAERITLHVVGVGTERAARVPLPDGSFMVDVEGNELTTELRPDILLQIGEAAGGPVYRADDFGIRDQLLEQVGGGRSGFGSGYEYQSSDRFRFFLGIGLVCLGLSLAFRLVRWRNTF